MYVGTCRKHSRLCVAYNISFFLFSSRLISFTSWFLSLIILSCCRFILFLSFSLLSSSSSDSHTFRLHLTLRGFCFPHLSHCDLCFFPFLLCHCYWWCLLLCVFFSFIVVFTKWVEHSFRAIFSRQFVIQNILPNSTDLCVLNRQRSVCSVRMHHISYEMPEPVYEPVERYSRIWKTFEIFHFALNEIFNLCL